MREIKDLDHFVLGPGETLILRCTRHVSYETLKSMREAIARSLPGRPVLVLPPDVEVMAGELEIIGGPVVADAESAEHLVEDQQKYFQDHYAKGRMVYAVDMDEGGDWFVIHRTMYPHTFDFERYQYSLTKPASLR